MVQETVHNRDIHIFKIAIWNKFLVIGKEENNFLIDLSSNIKRKVGYAIVLFLETILYFNKNLICYFKSRWNQNLKLLIFKSISLNAVSTNVHSSPLDCLTLYKFPILS